MSSMDFRSWYRFRQLKEPNYGSCPDSHRNDYFVTAHRDMKCYRFSWIQDHVF